MSCARDDGVTHIHFRICLLLLRPANHSKIHCRDVSQSRPHIVGLSANVWILSEQTLLMSLRRRTSSTETTLPLILIKSRPLWLFQSTSPPASISFRTQYSIAWSVALNESAEIDFSGDTDLTFSCTIVFSKMNIRSLRCEGIYRNIYFERGWEWMYFVQIAQSKLQLSLANVLMVRFCRSFLLLTFFRIVPIFLFPQEMAFYFYCSEIWHVLSKNY